MILSVLVIWFFSLRDLIWFMSWLLRTRSGISGLKWSPEFRGNMIGFWTVHLQRNLVMQLFLFDSCYFLGYLEIIWNHFDQTMWMSPFADARPLRDLNNARILSYSSSEEASGRSSRRKRKPTCYKEPPINRLGFKLFLPKTVLMLQPLLCSHILTLQGWTLCCFV